METFQGHSSKQTPSKMYIFGYSLFTGLISYFSGTQILGARSPGQLRE